MWRAVAQRVTNPTYLWYARRHGVEFEGSALFIGKPLLNFAARSKVSIGDRCVFTSRCTSTALGVNHAVILRTVLPTAIISIGKDVGMSGGVICAAVSIEIGDGCLLGANVTVVDTDFHEVRSLDRRYAAIPTPSHEDSVRIGRNVFLGAGAVILKGVTIGDDSVVGAGSVVAKSVPAGSICVGSPARVVTRWA